MKILHTLLLCLYMISAHSQTGHQNTTDGEYLFQKATFTIYNQSTKAQVDNRVIADPTLLDSTELFFKNVFLQASLYNGVLSFCTLPNHTEYKVENQIKLIPSKVMPLTKAALLSTENSENESVLNTRNQLVPYTCTMDDNTLVFTTSYLYGDSKYNFPLEGKLTVTMTKQK